MQDNNNDFSLSNKNGFRILGIGRQAAIKYFFGGNALISIVILVLITIFLAKEAFLFFPQSNTNLKIYRKSGKEFASHIIDQLAYQEEMKSIASQTTQYELFHRAGFGESVPIVFHQMKSLAAKKIQPEILSYKIAKDRLSTKSIIWEIWEGGKDESKKALAAQQKAETLQQLENSKHQIAEKITIIADEIKINNFIPAIKKTAHKINNQDKEVFVKLKAALIDYYSHYGTSNYVPEYVKQQQQIGIKNKQEISKQETFKNLNEITKTLTGVYSEYRSMSDKLRTRVSTISDRAESYIVSKDKEIAIKEGIPLASPKRKAELEVQLKRIINEEQDYAKINAETTSIIPQHNALQKEMITTSVAALKKLPDPSELQSPEARRRLRKLIGLADGYEAFMNEKRQKLENWRFDKKISTFDSLGSFFLGDIWVANSSWNNFFGIKPLFGGSLFITLIAITIATPFSIGGAIYVNRIASPLEQNIIKPIVEFIQAIPSVVIAFLGVLVIGEQILALSYYEWLNWIPGFPADSEQMMLTAGILLAFMAIPTMFTLAEDAINNVPKSYKEASLALGATKLQTVFKVILPCSLSGVVAAVLLGFARIIGETMVVLLVAGGRIKWPSTWTDPVHTMTGIIAQSTGEAAPGSIQYRALFLVGLVLFLISLILNSVAQNVIKRFSSKH